MHMQRNVFGFVFGCLFLDVCSQYIIAYFVRNVVQLTSFQPGLRRDWDIDNIKMTRSITFWKSS